MKEMAEKIPQNRNTLAQELATRNAAARFMTGGLYLPNPDPVLKKMGKDIETYEELLVDSKVSACVSSRKAGVQKLLWYIDGPKTPAPIVEWFEDVFRNTLKMREIVDGILDAPLFGYAPLEIMWKPRDGKIIPSALTAKPADWFVYDDDNTLRFLSVNEAVRGEEVPPRKFIVARHQATYKNPYGRPLLSACFWPCTFKKGGIKFWAIFCEKFGMPYVIGKHPRGAGKNEIDGLADALEMMVQDAIACVPDDSSVEILESPNKSASSDVYNAFKDAMNSEIALAILGQTLSSEVGKTGSYAASQSHMEVRGDIIDADKDIVEQALNELIRLACELNFSGVVPPVIKFYEKDDVDKTLAERDKTLSDMGVRFSPEYIVKAYNFEKRDIVSIERPVGAGPALFAETRTPPPAFPDQTAIDDLIRGLPGKELDAETRALFAPIVEMIENASSFDDMQKRLPDLYPDLDADALRDRLAMAMFLSDIMGRSTADEEKE